MGLRVQWSESALDDLDRALAYIAADNPEAAKRLGKKAREATRKLKDFPDTGRVVPEIQNTAIRELIVGPFRVIYRKTQEEVRIVYIVRAERDLDLNLVREP
jgi:toxin ParE1/3/4